jgi:HTH-type transcriptional regulator/antitoxin HigA
VKSLEKALLRERKTESSLHPKLRKAMKEGIESQMREMREALAGYDALKNAASLVEPVAELSDLPQVLVKARIMRGLTQRELAQKLHLKSQQIQRYESTGYKSASFSRVEAIAGVLGISFKAPSALTSTRSPAGK